MVREDIPAFIEGIISCGCTITSVGDDVYVIDDTTIFASGDASRMLSLRAMLGAYGRRDHLKTDIIDYLRMCGYYVPIDQVAA